MLSPVAALAAATLILTGCGSSNNSGATSVSTDPAKGTINIWVQGAEGAKLPSMFDNFKKDNPGVEFNLTEVPEQNFTTKITAAVTSGSVPDLIYGYSQTDASLLATKGFDPVPSGLVNKSDFYGSIWNLSEVKGVQYGVPWYANSNATYYRSDLAKAAGLETPKTWDDLIAYGKALKVRGVTNPVAVSIDWGVNTAGLLDVLNKQNGGGFLSADGTKWQINDPANVKALEFFGTLFQDGLSSPDAPTFLDLVPSIAQGRTIAVYDIGTFLKGHITQGTNAGFFDSKMSFAANPIPAGGTPAAGVSGGTWLVPSGAKEKDAAWKFVRYMSQPQSQVQWYKTFGDLPAVKAAWDDPTLSTDAFLKVARQGVENGVTSPSVATWPQVASIISSAAEQVARGKATAQQALDQAQARAAAVGTK